MRVRLGKAAQGALLAAYTGVVLVLTLLVEGGRGVRTNLDPFEDVRRLSALAQHGSLLSNRFLYALVGIVGNLALFAVWGFLAFHLFREKGRSPLSNHVRVVLTGALLSVAIETAQLFLPTRAADVNDVFWNVLGALAGSLAAHLHAAVTVEWE
jgi:glycopeptide antibiotics resistance protein